jgi:hypothetical protein
MDRFEQQDRETNRLMRLHKIWQSLRLAAVVTLLISIILVPFLPMDLAVLPLGLLGAVSIVILLREARWPPLVSEAAWKRSRANAERYRQLFTRVTLRN